MNRNIKLELKDAVPALSKKRHEAIPVGILTRSDAIWIGANVTGAPGGMEPDILLEHRNGKLFVSVWIDSKTDVADHIIELKLKPKK